MLKTEKRNEKSTHIDKMDTLSQLRLMNEENENAVKAVEAALPEIAAAVDAVQKAFSDGGRLFYIGAGTSGRLGVADAAECPPTFGVDDGRVIGIIAGGDKSLRKASENAEDMGNAGVTDLEYHRFCEKDILVGISAAGGAEYVIQAIAYANSLGCVTVGITSNDGSRLYKTAKYPIFTDTGAEVITGSTRLKAGTAQKLVLNMLSTLLFVKSGYVYENMMINLKPSNIKLKNRMLGIVKEITGCSDETAEEKLAQSGWNLREACRSKADRCRQPPTTADGGEIADSPKPCPRKVSTLYKGTVKSL